MNTSGKDTQKKEINAILPSLQPQDIAVQTVVTDKIIFLLYILHEQQKSVLRCYAGTLFFTHQKAVTESVRQKRLIDFSTAS